MCMLLLSVRTMMVIFQIIGSCQLMVCQQLDLALTAMLFTATRTAAFQRRHEVICGTIQQLRHHSWFLWRPKLPEPMLLRRKRFAYTGHLKFNRDSFLGSWISCCVLFQLTCCSGKLVLGFKMSVTDNVELVSINLWFGNRELSSTEGEGEGSSDDRWCIGALFSVAVTTSECISYHRV